MLNSYTFQHTIGQATESETPNSDGEPQDTYNMRAERGDVTPDFRRTSSPPHGPMNSHLVPDDATSRTRAGWDCLPEAGS